MIWTLARWSIGAAAVAYGALAMNHAIYGTWQTTAPPGYEHAEAWAFAAYHWYGISLSFAALAGLAAINLRRGWPRLRSRWTLFLTLIVILGIVVPRAHHFLAVDACLDLGGRWNYERQICERRDDGAARP